MTAMKIKTILILWTVVAVGTVVTTLVVLKYQTAPLTLQRASKTEDRAQSEQPGSQVHPAVMQVETPAPEPLPPEQNNAPPTQPVKVATKAQTATATPLPDPRFNDPAFKEQLGRYALSFVGDDPAADEVWASLIYDSSLSDTVREDLMEDLNENGFSSGDGRVATVDDLPLIESRIALLEQHMRDADEFMLTHLAEAYKDLVNIYVRLSR